MRSIAVLVALALTTVAVALAPTSAADSCRSAIAENTLCTPAYAAFCLMYGTKTLVSCEASVVARCLEWCPSDFDVVLP